MSDEDFPHLADERRAYRRRVAFSIIGVLAGVAVIVLRLAKNHEREQELEGNRRLAEALASYTPPPPSTDEHVPDHAPIELELVYGSRRFDVEGKPIGLGDGRTIELEAAPDWTYAGRDLSFSYSSSLRVHAGTSITLVSDEANAEFSVVESTASDAADLAEMKALYTSTGRVSGEEARSHTLLGKKTRGLRLDAGGLVIELLSARVDKKRRLRVIVTGTSSSASLAALFLAIETISTRPMTPAPEYTAILRGASGKDLAHAELAIGGKATLGEPPVEVSLERLALVRERLAGIAFEHAPELHAMELQVALPAVQLRSGEQGIQIMAPGIAMSAQEVLASASGGMVKNQRAVTRLLGGQTYQGVAGEMTLGMISLVVEVFSFERGGRDFIATLQYPDGASDAIARLAGPVLASVR